MGVALRDRRPTREAVHIAMEPSLDDMLEPEVLVLGAESRVYAVIMGDNKPDVPLYRLGDSILHWPVNYAPQVHSTTLYCNVTSFQSLPEAMCSLHCRRDGSGQRAYSLLPWGPNAPEEAIELRPRTSLQATAATASAATWEEEQGPPLLEAFVRHRGPRPEQAHLAAATAVAAGDDPAEELLFSTRPRWLSTTELNYLDADGRQLACEDRDYDENHSEDERPRLTRRLVVTVPMERRLRDALVGVWCLRMWRERIEEGEGQGRRRGRSSWGRGLAAEKDVGAGDAGVPGWDGRSKPRGEASLGQGTEGTRVPV